MCDVARTMLEVTGNAGSDLDYILHISLYATACPDPSVKSSVSIDVPKGKLQYFSGSLLFFNLPFSLLSTSV